MRRLLHFSGLVVAYFLIITPLVQAQVWHQGISETNINLRGAPVVVGDLSFNAPVAGNVLVQFDGVCVADVGDLIVMAASNTPSWTPNHNVSVSPANSDVDRGTFSHSQLYPVPAGNHTFYAVAENYVDLGGSGIASIYASLTVKFYPDIPDNAIAEHQGIVETNINLRGAPVVVGQINLNVTESGKAVVHFDGLCYADVGDKIVLGASDTPSWSVNDGNVSVEAINSSINSACFSHTQVYDVPAGSHDFYAVAENYVELGGSGMGSIYGNLTVEFFPNLPDIAFADYQGIVETNINLRGAPVVVGTVNINVTEPGKAVVRFDGSCYPDVGDNIVLAASNSQGWGINDGNVSLRIFDSDVNQGSFSHTRVYSVATGSHDFYAVAENYVNQGGSGMGHIYGSLTVEFIPDVITDVEKFQEIILDYSLEQNYPNPFNPTTKIKYQIPELSFATVKVYDVLGTEVATLINEELPAGSYEVEFNSTTLPSGIYFYRLQAGSFVETKKMVLMK
jgi:hypothetical protein